MLNLIYIKLNIHKNAKLYIYITEHKCRSLIKILIIEEKFQVAQEAFASTSEVFVHTHTHTHTHTNVYIILPRSNRQIRFFNTCL